MATELPPFSCTYSPNMPELLMRLNCSIAISTYQAGKVIFISAKNAQQLIQLPRSFKKPMGIGLQDNRMAIATRHEIVILQNTPGLGPKYPKKPDTYDALFMPRAVYYTGELDIHDLHWTAKGLLAVNTRFSCLSIINDQYSFIPVWQPNFIKSLEPTDHCHLNGLALLNDKPKYLTALGLTDAQGGWRVGKANGGVLLDADSQETILQNLAMPHSPRIFGKDLFALLSATGELIKIDVEAGRYEVVQKFNGFVRGMDRLGDYVFIGLSKLRTTSKAFGDLPIASRSVFSGVVVVHLPSGRVEAHIKYENSVEEIFDVRVLKGMKRPGILNHYKDEHSMLITMPQGNYWAQLPDEIENNADSADKS
ncbi:MAG: TIGR03032 family protein [Bacteroidota bacterium]